MQTLKQSTASQKVYVYLVDATDGYTPEPGVASPTIYLSKNGAAEAAPNDGTWAEIDATNMPGVYTLTLDATDTDTVGPLCLDVIKTGTSRHFVAVCYVSAALLAHIKTDTAAVLADTGTDGVVLSTATKNAIADSVVLDYLYQRYRFEKSLRMTKQEVKDEMRQVEGDPRVKARIRSLMRHLSVKRMMAEVPKADVVVTNPTHVAVALKYDGAAMNAPQVVAKGQGFIALKIIALAQEAGVPRVENRSLARSLYRLVEVGEVIPLFLYRAVAEVLAYIYGLRAQAGGE